MLWNLMALNFVGWASKKGNDQKTVDKSSLLCLTLEWQFNKFYLGKLVTNGNLAPALPPGRCLNESQMHAVTQYGDCHFEIPIFMVLLILKIGIYEQIRYPYSS